MTVHPIEPIYDKNSKILILGSFPSVKSRKEGFYYSHPQNRFWKVISAVLKTEIPKTVEQKKELLINNHIALWDVIASCEIMGSSDASINNVTPNDILSILEKSDICRICLNGKTAWKYYKKYIEPTANIYAVCLPSTSPANALWGFDKLVEEWSKNLKYSF